MLFLPSRTHEKMVHFPEAAHDLQLLQLVHRSPRGAAHSNTESSRFHVWQHSIKVQFKFLTMER